MFYRHFSDKVRTAAPDPPELFSTAAGREIGSSVRTLLGSSSALKHKQEQDLYRFAVCASTV